MHNGCKRCHDDSLMEPCPKHELSCLGFLFNVALILMLTAIVVGLIILISHDVAQSVYKAHTLHTVEEK